MTFFCICCKYYSALVIFWKERLIIKRLTMVLQNLAMSLACSKLFTIWNLMFPYTVFFTKKTVYFASLQQNIQEFLLEFLPGFFSFFEIRVKIFKKNYPTQKFCRKCCSRKNLPCFIREIFFPAQCKNFSSC